MSDQHAPAQPVDLDEVTERIRIARLANDEAIYLTVDEAVRLVAELRAARTVLSHGYAVVQYGWLTTDFVNALLEYRAHYGGGAAR
jgi:hypothetical protein